MLGSVSRTGIEEGGCVCGKKEGISADGVCDEDGEVRKGMKVKDAGWLKIEWMRKL